MDRDKFHMLKKQRSAPCLHQSKGRGTGDVRGSVDGDTVRKLFGRLYYPRERTISESGLENEEKDRGKENNTEDLLDSCSPLPGAENRVDVNRPPSSGEQRGDTDRPPPIPPRGMKTHSSAPGVLENTWPRDHRHVWQEMKRQSDFNTSLNDSLHGWGSPEFTCISRNQGSGATGAGGTDKQENRGFCLRSPLQSSIKHPQNSHRKLKQSRSSSSVFNMSNGNLCENQRNNHDTKNKSVHNNLHYSAHQPHVVNQTPYPAEPSSNIRHSPNSWPQLQDADLCASSSWNNEGQYTDPCFIDNKADANIARSKSLNDGTTNASGQNMSRVRPHSFNGFRNKNVVDGTQSNPCNGRLKRNPGYEDCFKNTERAFDVSRENSLVSEDEVRTICKDLTQPDLHLDGGYSNILPSPRVSPDIFHDIPGLVVTSDSSDNSDSHVEATLLVQKGQHFLAVPKKDWETGPGLHVYQPFSAKVHRTRRRRSLSLTSNSDESDVEPSPPLSRRGRRSAIIDTKNVGDVSPTHLSPEVSPNNSCDEGDGGSMNIERQQRQRKLESEMCVYPGDLLVNENHKKLLKRNTIAEFYLNRNPSVTTISSEDSKKGRQSSFSLLKLMRSRSRESIGKLEDVLSNMKPTEFKDNHLLAYKNLHWSDLIACTDTNTEQLHLTEIERKRREAVWELFQCECVFLINHLMVLKHCFMEPLKKCQVEGHLMFAEPQDLFGNLDELCYVSYTFCKDFIAALVKGMSSTEFGSTTVLLKAFDRFSSHSKDGDVYHTYCLNYTNALAYLERLRRKDDFNEFEKACTQDPRCKRLQLTDLLVAPMQHWTKFPLLLGNIRKYTEAEDEIQQLTQSISRVEQSLQKMEDKMKWAKNYERVQEINRQLIWPPVTDIDQRVFIPEFLKTALLKQPCDRLLTSCVDRQLLHEGPLTLVESAKTIDMHVFLFDDILLITRVKKSRKQKQQSSTNDAKQNPSVDKSNYTVHKQPIALDRVAVYDVSQSEALANGLKCAFVLVQISRYQQIIGVFTFQCPSDAVKNTWMEKIRNAKDSVSDLSSQRNYSNKKDTSEVSLCSSLFDNRSAPLNFVNGHSNINLSKLNSSMLI